MEEACKSLKLVRFFLFFPAEFFFSQIFLRGKVLSHRFHRYTQIFFIMIFLHRISRRNRKAFLLAGLLTDFRGILAAGQWLAPDICSCCFGHADFADDADFSSWEGFCPTDFTDIHRFFSSWFFFIGFHGWSEAFLLIGLLTDFRRTLAAGQWLAPDICSCCFGHADFADDADFSSWEGFVPQISQICTDFLWNLWWISLSNLRGYLQRPDRSHLRKSVSNRHSRKSPNKFRIIRWWKKSASSAKSAWQKNVPRKICVNLWNLWDFFQPQGVSATTGQVASAKSAWLKNRSTQMILPDFILFIWSFHYLIIPLQATLKWYTFKLEYKRKWSSKILSAS